MNIFAQRRENLRARLRHAGLDALLVYSAANRYYLSGFELHDPQFNESAGCLIICTDGQDWLATDPRYTEAAARLWDDRRILVYRGNGIQEIARQLRYCGLRIGFEAASVPYKTARALVSEATGLVLEPADGLVEKARSIKDSHEIQALEKSFRLNHELLQWIEQELQPDRTELEISWLIERYFREHGASELAFPNIVAVGNNAALPHAIPGSRKIEENCPVLIDIGCRVDDYCSDQTRTFWAGEQPAEIFCSTLELVQEAQRKAIAVLRPGLSFKEAYHAAWHVFEQAGVEQYFTHGLGHGVGLETHEAPSLSPRSEGILEAGMVVTVEPGLYYPEWGGVRWEYTVLITEDGVRIL